MAEQVAHAPFSPFSCAAYQPLYEVAWHTSPDTVPAQQESPFANHNHPPGADDQAKKIVLQIIDDYLFHPFFVSIRSVLQLDQDSWRAYLHIRSDVAAKGFLEPAQPAIWHVPPDKIWQLVVKLRRMPVFPSLQSDILAEVENAHYRGQIKPSIPQTLTHSGDRSSYGSAATVLQGDASVPLEPSADDDEGLTDAVQVLQSRIHNEEAPAPLAPPLNSAFAGGSEKPPGNRARQAPEGWLYHCPSEGCSKKPYKRLGHYEKHLRKTHPDFGPRHPYHSAQMSLKLGTSSSSSGGQSKDNLHGPAHSAVAAHTNVPPSRSSFASRRDSRVSSSSFNSTAVSPSAFEDVPESSVYAASGMTVAEASMLQDHSVWHTGGGALMDNMHVDTLGGFYTGLNRD